jgi:predicted DNA-binding transcriptional regulator AlpA
MLQSDEGATCRPAPVLGEFLSDRDLAAELKVSTRTLARWRRLREGPAITRIGRRVAYRREAVRQWLASRELEQ